MRCHTPESLRISCVFGGGNRQTELNLVQVIQIMEGIVQMQRCNQVSSQTTLTPCTKAQVAIPGASQAMHLSGYVRATLSSLNSAA